MIIAIAILFASVCKKTPKQKTKSKYWQAEQELENANYRLGLHYYKNYYQLKEVETDDIGTFIIKMDR